ncbi:LysM domain-containing protein [uncultured Microbacterium sp.]|uniref:LysM domain-containing protein n=1 Tax=uncultured Microbacterium sp. TaxID=191216 RepID=UPI0026097A4C|nr:LysM domain-containing protein [uncultured Microbacterium sp.]
MSQEQARIQLAGLLSQATTSVPAFAPNSRYHLTPTTIHVDADGEVIRHLRRRFLPDPDSLVQVGEHVVAPRDRLDLIAAEAFGDPELFWRICDAERSLHPAELTEIVGRRLRITLHEGQPGSAT